MSSRSLIIGCGELTDIILSLCPFPICVLFIPPYLSLAHSPYFYLSSSVSVGAVDQRSLEVGGKQGEPGVRGNTAGPEVGLRGEGQTLECVTKG